MLGSDCYYTPPSFGIFLEKLFSELKKEFILMGKDIDSPAETATAFPLTHDKHHKSINGRGGVGIIIYNFGGRSGQWSLAFMGECSEI
jgi:hypothetical protein